MINNEIWNLPKKKFENRRKVFWDIIKQNFQDKKISVLEIGVYKAGFLKDVLGRNDLKISRYTGIDPYLGAENDPYLGLYWKNKSDADKIYEESLNVFTDSGNTLVRTTSQEFYKSLKPNDVYDLIIIDGDHTFNSALWDLHFWFKRVKKGGMLIADDYANVDTPDVTRAINTFIKVNEHKIEKIGYKRLEFQNKGKYIPISLTFVYFLPKVKNEYVEYREEELERYLKR
ncbi:class I SAM-dependent methyltransferase [Anaeromicrobium sediminis]|nr:class I SAM-dependent methyltransferase [Anaeromicrobium sediminis]